MLIGPPDLQLTVPLTHVCSLKYKRQSNIFCLRPAIQFCMLVIMFGVMSVFGRWKSPSPPPPPPPPHHHHRPCRGRGRHHFVDKHHLAHPDIILINFVDQLSSM